MFPSLTFVARAFRLRCQGLDPGVPIRAEAKTAVAELDGIERRGAQDDRHTRSLG